MSRCKVIRASRICPSQRLSPTKVFSVLSFEKMSSGKVGVRTSRVCAVQGPSPTITFSFFPLNKSLHNHPVFTRFSLGVHSVFTRCSRTPVFARFSVGVLSVFTNTGFRSVFARCSIGFQKQQSYSRSEQLLFQPQQVITQRRTLLSIQ